MACLASCLGFSRRDVADGLQRPVICLSNTLDMLGSKVPRNDRRRPDCLKHVLGDRRDRGKFEKKTREPVLNVVDRVSEMLFGLFMALTFIGVVTVADAGRSEVHEMFVTALGCNLA